MMLQNNAVRVRGAARVAGRRQLVITAFRRGNDPVSRNGRNAQQQVQKQASQASRWGNKVAQRGRQQLEEVADDTDFGRPPKRTPVSYATMSAIWAGAAGFGLLAPQTVSAGFFNPSFLSAGLSEFTLIPLVNILALGFAAASVINYVQADAAKADDLGDDIHRRLNAALSTFAIANTSLVAIALSPLADSYLGASGTDLLNIAGAGALAAGISVQLYVAATNYAKWAPEGYNAVADVKSWLKDAQNTFSGLDGPLSSGYAILTAAFLASGIGYLVLPGLTLKGVFGPAAGDGAEELLLWQLIGVGVSMLVGPICYSLKEAAADDNLSNARNKLLNAGLTSAGVGHLIVLQPFLFNDNSGPLLPLIFGTWALAAGLGGVNLLQRPRY